MDDVHPSTEPASRPDQRALADEWETLRELLAAERVAIAALESHLAAGPSARPPSAARPAGNRRRSSGGRSHAVDRVDGGSGSPRGRTGISPQRTGPGTTSRSGRLRSPKTWRRCADRTKIASGIGGRGRSSGRLAPRVDQEAADLAAARDELAQNEAELARQQQQLAASRAALQVEQVERESREAQSTRDRQRFEADRRKLDADLDRLAAAEAAAQIEAERIERGKQQLERQTERYEQQRKLLEAERAKLAQERADLKLAQESARACQAEFTRAHERLEADRQQVSLERDRLVALESDTKNQRRRIAREFRVQHATHLAELEARREELESLVTATESELRSLAAATEAERKDELALVQQEERELRERVAQLGKLLNGRADELRRVARPGRHAHPRTRRTPRPTRPRLATYTPGRFGGARGARYRPRRRKRSTAPIAICSPSGSSAAQQRLEAGNSPDDSARRQELQRRFEMAVQDLREQKERNVDLENQLARKAAGVPPALGVAGDWESQKRLLLESLAADGEDDDEDEDPEITERRLSLQATIAITDEVVAQKDREIAELRQLLEEQAGNIGSIAVGATAIAGILDQDELIAQERARLAQVQAEWREKLRQAEIDISVQRATIARDRAEIDEKLANHKFDLDQMKAVGPSSTGAKPSRRWLSRLGIKDAEE